MLKTKKSQIFAPFPEKGIGKYFQGSASFHNFWLKNSLKTATAFSSISTPNEQEMTFLKSSKSRKKILQRSTETGTHRRTFIRSNEDARDGAEKFLKQETWTKYIKWVVPHPHDLLSHISSTFHKNYVARISEKSMNVKRPSHAFDEFVFPQSQKKKQHACRE